MTCCQSDCTDAEIQNHIEKLEQNICSCKEKIEWYKQKQERRKQKVPLGVPLDSYALGKAFGAYYFGFTSNKSKKLFDERLEEYVKALQKLAEGEQIDIKVLLPLLPKGWVAMNKYKNEWVYHKKKPTRYSGAGLEYWESVGWKVGFLPFNLKPAEDWRNSLMECGL